MQIEEIEKFLDTKITTEDKYIKIDFKKRDPIYGMFLKDRDYADLKSKNFWRIVTRTNFNEWQKSKSNNLARIFSGSDFSKLTLSKESFN